MRSAAFRVFRSLCVLTLLTCLCGCNLSSGIGGAGWDTKEDIEEAERYPAIQSVRLSVATAEVPFGTFRQEFDTVFSDFPRRGEPVLNSRTTISGTPFSISYENYVLKLLKDGVVIAERKLPRIFYMHPISSGCIPGDSHRDDIIVVRTNSRATTALHYVGIFSGEGEVLFERIMRAREDWDIIAEQDRGIVIGGARTQMVIRVNSK